MTSKQFCAVKVFQVFGILALSLGGGNPAHANSVDVCALEREPLCLMEKTPESGIYRSPENKTGDVSSQEHYAQMHGGCGGEGDHAGPGCMGRGMQGHHGRHGMHGRRGMHGMHGGNQTGEGGGGICPQERNTLQAPEPWWSTKNPLPVTREQIEQGRLLFQGGPGCTACHGVQGDGTGPMGMGLVPPPRNFTCVDTMRQIPDGQLFWIIRNGSEGTAMPAFGEFSDQSIWQIILYLRDLAKSEPQN